MHKKNPSNPNQIHTQFNTNSPAKQCFRHDFSIPHPGIRRSESKLNARMKFAGTRANFNQKLSESIPQPSAATRAYTLRIKFQSVGVIFWQSNREDKCSRNRNIKGEILLSKLLSRIYIYYKVVLCYMYSSLLYGRKRRKGDLKRKMQFDTVITELFLQQFL